MIENKNTELLPAEAMARRLGVEKRWLVAELEAGRIPGLRAGRTCLFDSEAVYRALAERAARVAGEEASDAS